MDELLGRARARLYPIALPAALLALVFFFAACSGDPAAPSSVVSPSAAPTPVSVPAPPAPPGFEVFVGAGDIASCAAGLADAEATSRLLDGIPGTVFTTGDNTQVAGTAEEFRDCYGTTWGRHKWRTRPTPGNHDYETANGSPYYDYFGQAAGPAGQGYYSYDLGAWHVISLNGNVSMKAGSAQANWLRQDLDAHRSACTLAYWHQPLFSSSVNGSNSNSRDAWQLLYEHGADVVLNGHDHLFERFAPQDPSGRRDDARGIRQFTVGTGGYALYDVVRLLPNSEVQGKAHGVLKFTLRANGYDWQFVPVPGDGFSDSGTGTCHGASGATAAPF